MNPLFHRPENLGDDGFVGLVDHPLNGFNETILAKHLFILVFGFGDAVGIENEQIVLFELDRRFIVHG